MHVLKHLFGNRERERLLNKYENIRFQDDDPLCAGSIFNVEWKKRNKSNPAGFSLVTVDFNDEAASYDNYESYLIYELFHDFIKDYCDTELNKSFHFSFYS